MKKTASLLALVMLFTANAFAASYWVVLRDGTRYECKQKPTVKEGKAYINLVAGPTLTVDPTQIDMAKSEEATRYGGGTLIAQPNQGAPVTESAQPSSLSGIRLRQPPAAAPAAGPAAPPPVVPGVGDLRSDVTQKFERAYENVGIFEHKVVPTGPHSLRAELTVDSEEKVFNAISATAFLAVRDAAVPGVHIDMVELFMKTTTFGAAGRFQMTREDAQAIDSKKLSKEDYFVRKVIY